MIAHRAGFFLLLLFCSQGCGGSDPPVSGPGPDVDSPPPAQDAHGVAVDDVLDRARIGDAAAQYDLGLRLAEGRGVPKNVFDAVHWFEVAAAGGHPEARFELGVAYMTGSGKRPDLTEAVRWFRAAGQTMEEGTAAADELESARPGRNPDANPLHVAMWLFEDAQPAAALGRFRALAAGGDTMAAYYTGLILHAQGDDGTPAEPREAEALRWYRRAAEAGNVWAQLDLAEVHVERSWGTGADDPAELAEARRWYRAAAAQGSQEALARAALLGLDAAHAADPSGSGSGSGSGSDFGSDFDFGPDFDFDFGFDTGADPPALPGIAPVAPDGRSELQICGRIWGQWQWFTGNIPGVLTFDMQNRVGASPLAGGPQVLFGAWTCDAGTSTFTISWQNRVVETFTMAADGSGISGHNNLGMPVRGTPLRR